MAKSDHEGDEVPIRFYIPSHGRSRAPEPINQPHWRYLVGFGKRPRAGEWIFMVSLLLITAAIFIMALDTDPLVIPLLIAMGVMGVFILLAMIAMAQSSFRPDEADLEGPTDEVPKERRKKLPKRRKDYR